MIRVRGTPRYATLMRSCSSPCALRRAFDKASGEPPLHMVSALGCKQRET
jgi:hypothetical protein